MKKTLLLLTLLANIVAMPVEAKREKVTPEQKGLQTINVSTAKAHVEFLASDWLKGREAGTEWDHIAGEYLIAELKRMGATPLMGESFVQPFEGYAPYNRSGYTVDPKSIEKIKQNPRNIVVSRVCSCGSNRIRTYDLPGMNRTLWPAELYRHRISPNVPR